MSPKSRQRSKTIAAVAVALLLLAWIQHSGFRTANDLREAWREQQALEREVEQLRRSNTNLETAIEELETNGRAVEELARTKLGLAREGEVVIRIPEKK